MSDKKTILIVDDDVQVQDLLQAFLESQGYDVLTARDGWNGVYAAIQKGPSLVLLDINMPFMDGFSAVQRIKNNPTRRAPKVILMSGLSGEEAEDKARTCGADDFVAKPFDLKDLAGRICDHLAQESDGGDASKVTLES